MGLQANSLKDNMLMNKPCNLSVFVNISTSHSHGADLVSVHELLTDDILTDARGWHQIVELVEELHTALMVLRSSFTQLVPEDYRNSLYKTA